MHTMKKFEGISWNFPWKNLHVFIKIQYDIRGWIISQRKGLKFFMKIQSDI